jgi:excisionase family DNA binding protein
MDQQTAAMTPDQAHALIGGTQVISRSTWYAAIKDGQVPHLRVGKKRILIPRAAFLRWLDASGFRAEAPIA